MQDYTVFFLQDYSLLYKIILFYTRLYCFIQDYSVLYKIILFYTRLYCCIQDALIYMMSVEGSGHSWVSPLRGTNAVDSEQTVFVREDWLKEVYFCSHANGPNAIDFLCSW